jgi:hypothetical protein
MIRAVLPPDSLPTAAEWDALAGEAWWDVALLVWRSPTPIGFPDCWAHYRAGFAVLGQRPPAGARAMFARALRHAWTQLEAHWRAGPREEP